MDTDKDSLQFLSATVTPGEPAPADEYASGR